MKTSLKNSFVVREKISHKKTPTKSNSKSEGSKALLPLEII